MNFLTLFLMPNDLKTPIFRFVKVRPPRKPVRSAVQSGFEEQALHLLANGYTPYLSTGGILPAINSDIYYSVMEEIWESRQNEAEQTPTLVGETFKIKVPTSLVVLQCGSGCVEGTGLPCNCEGHEGAGAGTGQVLIGINNTPPPTT